MSNLAHLRIPQELIFGEGSAETLGEQAQRLGAGSVLLISDHGLQSVGLVDQALAWLQQSQLAAEVYLDVEPEPSITNLEACLAQAKEIKPDVVIGLGGGSALDIAKAAAMLLANDGPAIDYLGTGLVKQRGVPTILLPTTAGTGAEITPNALFYVPEKRAKIAIVSPFIIPDVAIVDPLLTLSVPPALTAATGLDALCHAVESYTGLNATSLSKPFAAEAVKQIGRHLRTAVISGDNREARYGMALGSMYAAVSIANSGTNAVHALAYPLQGLNRIQHGVANSLLLPSVMAFNMLGDLDGFAEIADLMGVPTAHLSKRDAAQAAVTVCKELSEDIGIPQSLHEVGITEDQIGELTDGALEVQRLLKNNPRPIFREDIEAIFKQIL